MKYGGPRTFSTDNPLALRGDLEALVRELSKLFAAQQDGGRRRWLVGELLRGDGALSVGTLTPVDTSLGTTARISLPPWDSTLVGLECALERRSSAGVITVRPVPGTLLCGATAALTVPTAVRTYVYVATPAGWSAFDDA